MFEQLTSSFHGVGHNQGQLVRQKGDNFCLAAAMSGVAGKLYCRAN